MVIKEILSTKAGDYWVFVISSYEFYFCFKPLNLWQNKWWLSIESRSLLLSTPSFFSTVHYIGN